MIKRCKRVFPIALALFCAAAARAGQAVSVAAEIDCSKCMFLPGAIPKEDICPLVDKWKAGQWETYRKPGAYAIAEAEDPQLKESLLNGTDGFWFGDEYIPDKNYLSETHYTFAKMSFMRNDFGATGQSTFRVKYGYPLDHPEQWTGVYLYPGRRYVVLAYDWDHGRNAPILHMACEVPKR